MVYYAAPNDEEDQIIFIKNLRGNVYLRVNWREMKLKVIKTQINHTWFGNEATQRIAVMKI